MTKRELREKTNAAVKLRATEKEKAADFKALMEALPPDLANDEKCGKILRKHGFGGGHRD